MYNIGGVTTTLCFVIIIPHKQCQELPGCKKSSVSHEHRAWMIIVGKRVTRSHRTISVVAAIIVLCFSIIMKLSEKKHTDAARAMPSLRHRPVLEALGRSDEKRRRAATRSH